MAVNGAPDESSPEALQSIDESAVLDDCAPLVEEAKGRAPFCDAHAELRVLTAILDPVAENLINRIPWLEPRHFFFERNRRVFEACCALRDKGVAITPTSVKHWLDDRKQWSN